MKIKPIKREKKMSTQDKTKLHVALFPWLAFGHMIPYLDLAKLIARKGHQVTFISTPNNITRLPKLPTDLESSITFLQISLPSVDKLPQDAESTTDVSYKKVPYLKQAYDLLEQPIRDFLETHLPDWIFYDFLPHWLPKIARDIGVSNGHFSIFMAATVSQVKPVGHEDTRLKAEDFLVPPKWIPFPTTVAFRLFEINQIFDSFVTVEGHVPDNKRIEGVLEGCDIIVVRSCREFEPQWLDLLKDLQQKPVIPVGQLPKYDDDGDEDETWLSIKAWLDKQEKGTVVFVAFGSEAKLTQTQLTEMAHGLELSGLPFFWVLRTHHGSSDDEPVKLPEGFEERTRGQGLVYTSWAPQFKILSHDSIGGFLCHSGWSSVIEGIQCGKPLLLFTFMSDQGWTSKVLEEKKLGYSIPRDEQDGSFTRESVADSLKLVLVAEEGRVYRDKVQEMKGVFGDKNKQDKYIEEFLDYLVTHKGMHNKN